MNNSPLSLWQANLTKLPKSKNKILEHFIKLGHLAPSSHNTQPWLFKPFDFGIEVYADMNKRLLVADPTNKELYVSLGCAIANIQIGASYFGYESEIKFLPKNSDKKLVAQIQFVKSRKKSLPFADLLPYINKRLTNRSPFKTGKQIPESVFKKLNECIADLSVDLYLTTDREQIAILAQMTKDGIYTALSNPEFGKELSKWVRHNWTKQGDGLPGNTLGIPDAISIIAPALIRSPLMAAPTSKSEEIMVNSASAVAIVLAKEDSIINWLNTGIAYERMALILTKHKISSAVLSAILEMPQQKKELIKMMNNRTPMLFFRIGYPTKPFPHSPRRQLDKIIIT